MADQRDVAVIVGSLREASLHRQSTTAVPALAPGELRLDEVRTGDPPLFADDSSIQNEQTRRFLAAFMSAFAGWSALHGKPRV